jgi:tetratricopeptide (TPR) repeat protein
MKKSIVVLVMLLCRIFSLPAQEYAWDEFGYDDFEYDWGAEIEEPPDFVDPYAPVPPPKPPPAPAAPVAAEPEAAEPAAAEAPFSETPFPEAQAVPEPNIVAGAHYRVFSDSGEADAALLLKELELRLDFYNRLFRFDREGIAAPLQVRSIAGAETYEAYVRQRLDQTPPGAVYIHYKQPERRELVIHRGSDAEAAMVAYQTFIQYLRAFIPDPPSWIRDGFAVLFSSLRFDPASEALLYDENLAWLDTVKKLGNGAAPPRFILLADTEEYARGSIDNFQALSWALASFFLNYDTGNYFRALTEMFMVLSPDAGAAENSQAAVKRLTLWTDFDGLAGDYQNYLDAKKSFAELIEAGQKAYSEGDFEAAEQRFAQARSMRPEHAVPCYYQGLLAYAAKDFAKAEELYTIAFYNGADAALVHYALGLNAVSAGRSGDGIRWLEQAAAAGPDRFGDKANSIINKLR